MANVQFKPLVKGNYINGEFLLPDDPNGTWVDRSPADFSDELGVIEYSYAALDQAVNFAHQEFRKWKTTPIAERAEYLKKYQSELKKRSEEIVEIIAREAGKPLWEAKTELTAMLNKVDVTIQESMKLVSDFEIQGIMENTRGYCHYRPLGVMAVVGPFNFPGHLPNGHIIPALLTGNTVVFKPSEKTPLVGQVMAECFHAANLPPGVFNLVQGEKEVGRRLSIHEKVAGVLFTGSYEVGVRIKQDTLLQHWKVLALEMGGKNPSIVWEDADLDLALYETLVSGYVTAGQRCSATSRIIVHRNVFDQFLNKFHNRAKAFSIGHPIENPFMGPLIEQGAVDRYMKFLGIAVREGCEMVMRGKPLDLKHKGNYVTPSICLVKDNSLEAAKKSVYQQTEIFGPNVAIIPVDDLDHAIQLANCTHYGLVASVFSKNRKNFEKCFDELDMGLINWNKSTVGASSRLPFGGFKKSGNHTPTALTAPLYCTAPVSSLEVADTHPGSINTKMPGLNWE
jgi:succinylglutamic semialdehyde dehydrogenase